MSIEAELELLRSLLGDSKLERVDEHAVAELRQEFPDLPPDYFDVLHLCGFGSLRGSRFMVYGGPVDPDEIFDPEDPICRTKILLVGDDYSGGHLGYLKNDRGWDLCFFDHMSTDDLQPEADGSIVRFLVTILSDPED